MDQVSQIREKIDLVSYLSESLTLKKAGRNFKALCPFHGEKSPSFMVSAERQIWHCFGCGKGGDIYTFLMEYEHIEFPEALRILAKRAGVELVQQGFEAGISSKKEKLYKINALASEFYHYVLTKHNAGKKARDYLEKRQISPKVVETFRLGFAPGIGNALTTFLLNKKQLQKDEVLEAGLGFLRGREVQDFFRGRLIFPLIDHRDNVVGFAGRVLDGTTVAKYMNTRETLVYHKGEQVYGLNITKEAIRKQNQVLLVEGEFDVLSCFQEGLANVVAVKGTALTDQQIRLLSRYAQKITFCFDGDRAGQEAIKRSLPLVEKQGLSATVVIIPNGKDPDDAIKQDGLAFKQAVKRDISVYDYLLESALAASDKTTPEGKRQIGNAFLPTVAAIENAIVKEHYIRKLSSELDTSYESIVKEMQQLKQKAVTSTVAVTAQKSKRPRDEVLEEYLLSLILQSTHPRQIMEKPAALLAGIMAKDRSYQKIFFHLQDYFSKGEDFSSKAFGEYLSPELADAYNTCLLLPLPQFADDAAHEGEVIKTAMQLRTAYIKQKIKVLAEAIRKQDTDMENEEIQQLQAQYSSLVAQLQEP